jgi:hypothetical protein
MVCHGLQPWMSVPVCLALFAVTVGSLRLTYRR